MISDTASSDQIYNAGSRERVVWWVAGTRERLVRWVAIDVMLAVERESGVVGSYRCNAGTRERLVRWVVIDVMLAVERELMAVERRV